MGGGMVAVAWANGRASLDFAFLIASHCIKTPCRRHFEPKWTPKMGSTSKIGSSDGFGNFFMDVIFRHLSPMGC